MASPSKKISIDKIAMIVRLTEEGLFRREIARRVEASWSTVYKYQKIFNLI